MIFSEIYGAYYNAVAKILRAATDKPIAPSKLHDVACECAFGESFLTLESALSDGRWQLLSEDGKSLLAHAPTLPLTDLQKAWWNSICTDPRIRLFGDELPTYKDVPPLFTPEDVYVFDAYADGDNYTDEAYIKHFRTALAAIRTETPLRICQQSRNGRMIQHILLPERLEYSEKDDKFRLIGRDARYGTQTFNLGKLTACKPYTKPFTPREVTPPAQESVVLELVDERNALERALLHFAHFEKEAERLADNRYRITVRYDKDDETEMVIRVLSFGPFLKATSPESFVNLIKKRLIDQKSCELF